MCRYILLVTMFVQQSGVLEEITTRTNVAFEAKIIIFDQVKEADLYCNFLKLHLVNKHGEVGKWKGFFEGVIVSFLNRIQIKSIRRRRKKPGCSLIVSADRYASWGFDSPKSNTGKASIQHVSKQDGFLNK